MIKFIWGIKRYAAFKGCQQLCVRVFYFDYLPDCEIRSNRQLLVVSNMDR